MATINDLTPIAESIYNINAAGETLTLELVSPPGMGKTSWARQFAAYMAQKTGKPFGLSVRHLSTEDPLDGPGVLHIGEDENGTKTASRTYPGLFPQPWEFPDGVIPDAGVLVLDEYGQADHDQHKSTATLIDERRLGRYKLPQGWMVLATSNRSCDRAGVDKPLTFITTRKSIVELAYVAEQHAQWLMSKGVHHKLRGFVMANPSVVQAQEVPDHDKPYSTARSFYRACLLLQSMGVVDTVGQEESPSHLVRLAREAVMGTIGEGPALRLFGHLRYCEHMVSIDEIYKSPMSAVIPERPDVQWAVVQMLADYARTEYESKSTRPMTPLLEYMGRLPVNFQMTCVRMIAKANKKIMMDSRYADWIRANRQLVMDALSASQN